MTFAIKSRSSRSSVGFTLLELLIVVGVIALLIGILAPAASLMLRKSNAARVRADLNTIAQALQAYKDDFNGQYPQVTGLVPETGALELGTGAHVLCKALFGLGPAYPLSASDFAGADGADGPGFRLRPTIDDGANPRYKRTITTTNPMAWTTSVDSVSSGQSGDGLPDSFGGKVYGPYLKPENFRFDTDPDFKPYNRIRILDHTGSPILYYPASAANVNMAANTAPVLVWEFDYTRPVTQTPAFPIATTPGNTTNYRPIFNANDNIEDQSPAKQPQLTRYQLLVMLGDYNQSYRIEPNNDEPAGISLPFLLWTRGPDGKWGPQDLVLNDATTNRLAADKCDDVTNLK